jgi:outer membrane protein assembly factor BamB
MLLLVGLLTSYGSVLTLGQPPQGAWVPSLKWTYEFPLGFLGGISNPALSSDGTVYVFQDCPYALDPQGRLKWQYAPSESGRCSLLNEPPVVDSQGDVYGAGVRIILAVRADGSTKWTREVLPVPSALAYGQDGIYTSLGVGPIALDAQSGSVKWGPLLLTDFLTLDPHNFANYLEVAPPLIRPNGTILVVATLVEDPGNRAAEFRSSLLLYTFSADGGLQRVIQHPSARIVNPLPDLDTGVGVRTFSAVPGTDGKLYIAVRDRYFDEAALTGQLPGAGTTLYALDTEGNILWDWPRRGELASSEPVLGADGTIYLGLQAYVNVLYALSPDGDLKWSYSFAQNEIISGTPAVGVDGVIYVPTAIFYSIGRKINHAPFGGKIYALSSEGELHWIFTTEGDILSSPALAPDGILYFTSFGPCQWKTEGGVKDCEGRAYALQTGSPGLADSPWPMFRGDPQHSGQVHVPSQSR